MKSGCRLGQFERRSKFLPSRILSQTVRSILGPGTCNTLESFTFSGNCSKRLRGTSTPSGNLVASPSHKKAKKEGDRSKDMIAESRRIRAVTPEGEENFSRTISQNGNGYVCNRIHSDSADPQTVRFVFGGSMELSFRTQVSYTYTYIYIYICTAYALFTVYIHKYCEQVLYKLKIPYAVDTLDIYVYIYTC